ncbi:MAG: DUF1847 domain-containing protein, partial [Planctomycetes bacterium]|nr:DUF1847 domain-containing protein [Planctomycetota bacterium]
MECAICNDKLCYSQGQDCTNNIIEQVREEADKYPNTKLSAIASILEARDYMKLTRLEETIKFAQELKFDRIGIAFCIGLSDEARVLHDILIKMFRVSSVCCKVGGINKKERGLPNIKKERYEAICNPIGQAFVLNDKNTEMNIILGLCVGHD